MVMYLSFSWAPPVVSHPRRTLLPPLWKTSGMSIAVKAKSGKDSEKSRHPFAIDPPLHPSYDLRDVIRLALKEDSGNQGDVTCMATVPSELEVEGHFLAKEDGVIAGIALADMIFEEVDPSLETCWFKEDGDSVHRNVRFGKVCGRARSIIVAERVALNFMQRMSGIATQTKAMSEAAYPAVVLETRKTAPCLRVVDKWAVLIGGGENHRMGLFDAVLVKDNHVTSAGGVTEALSAVDRYLRARNLKMNVVVEARTLGEVEEVLRYPDGSRLLTRIMLDNMVFPLPDGGLDTSLLRRAVSLIAGRFEIEASGNVTLETLPAIAKTGVTHISSGALTHSVKALDISLKILVNAPS